MSGAGISADSGIPTFRGKEGYWTVGSQNYRPEQMATQAAFRRMPREVWRWYLYRRGVCRRAQPNRGHTAVAALERGLGDRFLVVTQNVDGLHLRAGNSLERTYQIHGNVDFMRCTARCSDQPWPMAEDLQLAQRDEELGDSVWDELVCPRCDERSRPHVLWFDETYNEHHYRFESSLRAAAQASLLVVVGTSGATNLPMQMGVLAARTGAALVDINPDDNPFSQMAAQTRGGWLRCSATEGLARVEARLLA